LHTYVYDYVHARIVGGNSSMQWRSLMLGGRDDKAMLGNHEAL
jgi:hypothetical protein